MKIYESKFSDGWIEKTIELEDKDKWWLKKLCNSDELKNDIEISFKLKNDCPIPIFDKKENNPDFIQIFSSEEIKEILLNSKSRVRKRFHFEFIKVE